MPKAKIPGLFVTGTDTGVGKTYVAALVAQSLREQGLRVGVYKPAASGCRAQGGDRVSDDAVALWEAAGRPGTLRQVCPQCFAAPLAPHLAAIAEGQHLDEPLLRSGIDFWRETSDIVLVEGAGGLLSPLGQGSVADLAGQLGFPLVVVARDALGTINHTLLTLLAARAHGLGVAAVVLNGTPTPDASTASNRAELLARCGAVLGASAKPPLWTTVAFGGEAFIPAVDWAVLATAG